MWTKAAASVTAALLAAAIAGPASRTATDAAAAAASAAYRPAPPTEGSDPGRYGILPEVWFDNVPLDQAAEALRRMTGLSMAVDWPAVEAAGVSRNRPINLNLHDVPLTEVLSAMRQATRGPTVAVTWARRGNVLYFGTDRLNDPEPTVRTYPVSDLLARAADGRPATRPTGGNICWPSTRPAMRAHEYGYAEVTEGLTTQVDPEGWADTGGRVGRLGAVGDTLVIRQSPDGHRQIEALLAALRSPTQPPDGPPPVGPPATLPADTPTPRRASAIQVDPPPGQAESRLDSVLPEVRFERTPLREALDSLVRRAGTNVAVDWAAAAGAGIDRATPVDLTLTDVTLADALDAILFAVRGKETRLAWAPSGNVIYVGLEGPGLTPGGTPMRVYDVADLLRPGTAGDAGSIDRTTEDLVELIQESVDAYGWREAGGMIGEIRVFVGRFVIRQTRDNHRQIEALLGALREAPAVTGAARPATRPASRPVKP